jgi:hypothetical protein
MTDNISIQTIDMPNIFNIPECKSPKTSQKRANFERAKKTWEFYGGSYYLLRYLLLASDDFRKEHSQTFLQNMYETLDTTDKHFYDDYHKDRKAWEENDDTEALYNYASYRKVLLRDEDGSAKLHYMNCTRNRNSKSLYAYAEALRWGLIQTNTNQISLEFDLITQIQNNRAAASDAHKMNWYINHNADSLYEYACMLAADGDVQTVQETNVQTAHALHCMNYKLNNHCGSLFAYFICVYYGEGCAKNKSLAKSLLEEYKKSQDILDLEELDKYTFDE